MKMSAGICKAFEKEDDATFYLCDFAFLVSVINICILEWYLFPEAMVMYALALWGATQAALSFVDKTCSTIRSLISSFIYLFIGINSYQAILGWYIALSLMIILARMDFYLNKNSFLLGVGVMFIGGINSLLNQLIVKLSQTIGIIENSSRHATLSLKKIMMNGEGVYHNQKDFLKNGYHLLPDYFLFGLILLGILLLYFALKKHRMRRFLAIGTALGSGYLLTLIPHIFSSSLWVTLRTLPAVFVILSLLFVATILCGGTMIRKISGLLILIAIMVGSFSISVIITDHMTTVHTDIVEGKSILHRIEEYEKETGLMVNELYIMPDDRLTPYYPGVKTMWMDINLRHMTVEWEKEPFLEILSGRDFSVVSLSPKDAEPYVQGRNWNYADYDEQISFDGNRAYVILY